MAALLLYLYTGSYHNDGPGIERVENMWKHHFEVSRVADKYLVSTLEQAAYRGAVDLIERLDDTKDIIQVIKYLRTNVIRPSPYFNLEDLVAKHQAALIQEPEYRHLLETDNDLMWICMDRLASSFSDTNLVELACYRCTARLIEVIWQRRNSASGAWLFQIVSASGCCDPSILSSSPLEQPLP